VGRSGVYIKINESEIADDYPEPAQYEKVGSRHIKTADAYWFHRHARHACMQEKCLAHLNTLPHANAAVAFAACLFDSGTLQK